MTTEALRAEPSPTPACKGEKEAIAECNRAYESKKKEAEEAKKVISEYETENEELTTQNEEQEKDLKKLSRNPFIMAGAGALAVAVNPVIGIAVILGIVIFN